MIEKIVTHDVQVLEDGQMQVRQITRIMEDEIELSKTFHRKVMDVGDDMTNEAELIQDVAKGLHTPARKKVRDDIKNKTVGLAR